MSAVAIRPATEADAAAIARTHYDALATYHDFYAAFFATHPKDILPSLTLKGLREPSKSTFLVAADTDTDEVVGYVRYSTVEAKDTTAANETTDEEGKGEEQPSPFAPKEHMKDLWKRFNERQTEMDAVSEKAVDGKRHKFIWHLMIDPAHQRKGIGKRLLEAVLAQSDAEGLPVTITSSAESHGLYLKVGFEDLGTFSIDNGHWAIEIVQHEQKLGIPGNEGLEKKYAGVTEVECCMVRWPKTTDRS